MMATHAGDIGASKGDVDQPVGAPPVPPAPPASTETKIATVEDDDDIADPDEDDLDDLDGECASARVPVRHARLSPRIILLAHPQTCFMNSPP
jgi:hypothetical protein